MRFVRVLILGTASSALAACGGGGGDGASCSPGPTASVAITSAGLSPVNVCIQPGGTVTFNNSTAAARDIVFDTDGCPPTANIPQGGQVVVTFPAAQSCSFHDGQDAANAAFQGTVAVTSVMVSGGGY